MATVFILGFLAIQARSGLVCLDRQVSIPPNAIKFLTLRITSEF